MTTIEIAGRCPEERTPRLERKAPNVLRSLIRRWRERRAYAALARLPDHLICDAGFDPSAVRAAAGSWDGLGR